MSLLARLIFWDSWPLSTSVFSSGLVLLASCLHWSLLSVTATLLLYTFLASLGYKLYVHLMGFMKKPCKDILTELQKIEVEEKDVEKVLCKAGRQFKIIVEHGLALLLAHDIEKSAKFCLFLYLLTYLGNGNMFHISIRVVHSRSEIMMEDHDVAEASSLMP